MFRREFLNRSSLVAASSTIGAMSAPVLSMEQALTVKPGSAEHVIFIWLGGGMSQIDTFDPKQRGSSAERKPGTDYDIIGTAVQGVQVCQHLPRVAERMDRVTALRTVHHEMIDEHAAAVYWVHVGRPVSGTIQYPSLGAVVSHQLGNPESLAPAYTVIGYPNVARSPGFLGAHYGYLYLTDLESGPRGFSRPNYVDEQRVERRLRLLDSVRESSRERLQHSMLRDSQDEALSESLRLSGKQFMEAFDLKTESPATRELYGGEFGQRCLLARRLTERGVRFIEVAHNLNFVNGTGWDTHREGQQNQWTLIRELDQAMGA
ncbi:MAG: DUF1501 domain-containing protein, partial [Planctomycetales bacterium]|nr:DUF1501 domain-containing protein [Planctomycetales bacterium]